jgi:four helix bundle protein
MCAARCEQDWLSHLKTACVNTVKSHKDLVVWQKSVALASAVYAATRTLPNEEQSGLNAQLRRSAVLVATRIAEGFSRRTTAEFVQSLQLARGSLSELETQTLIAIDQSYLTRDLNLSVQIDDVDRLLGALIQDLRAAKQAAHARACSVQQPRNVYR